MYTDMVSYLKQRFIMNCLNYKFSLFAHYLKIFLFLFLYLCITILCYNLKYKAMYYWHIVLIVWLLFSGDIVYQPVEQQHSEFIDTVKTIQPQKRKLYNKDALINNIENVQINEKHLHDAITLLTVKIPQPLSVAYIAAIDLKNPDIEIVITPRKKPKSLTSAFAKQHNCLVAINGEAGVSPRRGCPLGQWCGNWVVNGQAISLSDTHRRPFLAFNRQNIAHYSPQKEVDTLLTPQKYNTIWGRYDILVNGEIYSRSEYRPRGTQYYPRTIMGVNSSGDILYLMVVDGRRKSHSIGMKLPYAARVMQWIGATNAMACDQGGSSCMFAGDKIISKPADGAERVVYTHFGIRIVR